MYRAPFSLPPRGRRWSGDVVSCCLLSPVELPPSVAPGSAMLHCWRICLRMRAVSAGPDVGPNAVQQHKLPLRPPSQRPPVPCPPPWMALRTVTQRDPLAGGPGLDLAAVCHGLTKYSSGGTCDVVDQPGTFCRAYGKSSAKSSWRLFVPERQDRSKRQSPTISRPAFLPTPS